jgi:hypothetical protein
LAEAAEDLRSSPFRGMRVLSRRMAWSSHTQACIFLHNKIAIRKKKEKTFGFKKQYHGHFDIEDMFVGSDINCFVPKRDQKRLQWWGLGERSPKSNPKRATGYVVFIIPVLRVACLCRLTHPLVVRI